MKGQAIVAIAAANGGIVPISAVVYKGLKCRCVCAECGDELQAVLDTKNQKHFRHHTNANCNPTPESQLHLMAKAIIEKSNCIYMPGQGMMSYTNPKVEARCEDLRPDATITVNGQPLYVEIVVTSPIFPPKREKYKTMGAKVLVINLSEDDRRLDEETLGDLVLNEPDRRSYLRYDIDEKAGDISKMATVGFFLIPLVLTGAYLWNLIKSRKHY